LAGVFLLETKPTASKRAPTGKLSPTVRAALSNIAKKAGLGGKQKFTAFAVKGAQTSKGRAAKKAASAPSRYLVAIGTPKGETVEKVKRGVAVVAKELKGRIVGYRIYNQR
jgi:hypothetical protein